MVGEGGGRILDPDITSIGREKTYGILKFDSGTWRHTQIFFRKFLRTSCLKLLEFLSCFLPSRKETAIISVFIKKEHRDVFSSSST